MSELFSKTRLVDYFILLDTKITSIVEIEKQSIPLQTNNYNIDNINNFNYDSTKYNNPGRSSTTLITPNTNLVLNADSNYNSMMHQIVNSHKIQNNSVKPMIKFNFDKLKVECKYDVNTKIPEVNYKTPYELHLDSIWSYMPTEHIYTLNSYTLLGGTDDSGQKRQMISTNEIPQKMNIFTNFFSMIFTNINGGFYYGHFLRVYQEEYVTLLNTSALVPKYLILFSVNPFFISFKSLLEEIYINSISNFRFNFKSEKLLSCILFKSFLPIHPNTQFSFSLLTKNYNFTNNPFHSEVSLKLLFSVLTPDRVQLLFLALLMNSKIIIFHSHIELFCPLISCLMQILVPLQLTYNIINNLNPLLIELLEAPSSNLIVGINKKEFSKSELEEVYQKIHSNTIDLVYCDLDTNQVIISYSEEIRKPGIIPTNLYQETLKKLEASSVTYDDDFKKFLFEVLDDNLLNGLKEVTITGDEIIVNSDLNKVIENEIGLSMSNNMFWDYISSFKVNEINEYFIKNTKYVYSFGNCLQLFDDNNKAQIFNKKQISSNFYNKMNNGLINEQEIKSCFLYFIAKLFYCINKPCNIENIRFDDNNNNHNNNNINDNKKLQFLVKFLVLFFSRTDQTNS